MTKRSPIWKKTLSLQDVNIWLTSLKKMQDELKQGSQETLASMTYFLLKTAATKKSPVQIPNVWKPYERTLVLSRTNTLFSSFQLIDRMHLGRKTPTTYEICKSSTQLPIWMTLRRSVRWTKWRTPRQPEISTQSLQRLQRRLRLIELSTQIWSPRRTIHSHLWITLCSWSS